MKTDRTLCGIDAKWAKIILPIFIAWLFAVCVYLLSFEYISGIYELLRGISITIISSIPLLKWSA